MLSQTSNSPALTLQPVVRLSMASAPAPASRAHPQLGIYTVAFAGILFSTAVVYIYTRRYRARARIRRQEQLKYMSDLEAQGQVRPPTVKNGLRPMPANSGRTLSASEVMSGSKRPNVAGELRLPVVQGKYGPPSRPRDSICCKAISQSALPDAGRPKPSAQKGAKSNNRGGVIEATAGLEDPPEDLVSRPLGRSLWGQHPSSTPDEATDERAVDMHIAPSESIPLIIPEIIVVPPSEDDEKPLASEDSFASMYSQDSFDQKNDQRFSSSEDSKSNFVSWYSPLSTPDLEMDRAMILDTPELDADIDTASTPSVGPASILSSLDTPPLETPPLTAGLPLSCPATLAPSASVAHVATDVSYYFPTLPTFAAADYLQIPLPSWNTPRVQSATNDDDYDEILEFMASFGLDDSSSSSMGSARRPAPSPPNKCEGDLPASKQDLPNSTSGSPDADTNSCPSRPSEFAAKFTQASNIGLGLSVSFQSQQGGDGQHPEQTSARPQRHVRQSKPKSKPKKMKPKPHSQSLAAFSIWEDCERDRKMQAILTKFWICDDDRQREELQKAMKELVDGEVQRTATVTQASDVKQQPAQAQAGRDVHVDIRGGEPCDGLVYDYDLG